MRVSSRRGTLAVPLFAFVVACGGSRSAPSEPVAPPSPPDPPAAEAAPPAAPPAAEPAPSAAAPAPEATPPAPPARDWHALTDDQKKAVMKTEVVPRMKELFGAFDPKEFTDVKCTTCHGASAMQGKFDMPNPRLPKLDPTNDFEKHKKKDAKILAFMMQQVVPEMAKIIGEPVYDTSTQKGFGCGECHTFVGGK